MSTQATRASSMASPTSEGSSRPSTPSLASGCTSSSGMSSSLCCDSSKSLTYLAQRHSLPPSCSSAGSQLLCQRGRGIRVSVEAASRRTCFSSSASSMTFSISDNEQSCASRVHMDEIGSDQRTFGVPNLIVAHAHSRCDVVAEH
jgi:hypothetical protein